MLHRYTGRHFGDLATHFVDLYQTVKKPLLAPFPVIVPNQGVGRWLVQCVAQHDGICANLERILPAEFLWRCQRQLNPALSKQSDFDGEVLSLRIYAILQDAGFVSDFPRLKHYLMDCRAADCMALADKLAQVFDGYQHYRGDWLNRWQQGSAVELTNDMANDQTWQRALWRRLCDTSSEAHRVQLQQALMAAFNTNDAALNLPAQIFVFGLSTIQPTFVEALKALAEHNEVHLFAFSPQESAANTVLSHWKAPFNYLQSQLVQDTHVVAAPDRSDSCLQNLQRLLTGYDAVSLSRAGQDNSLVTVSCFSAMREVEALHDFLLQRFAADDSLQAADVLVATPDLDRYAPFIRAVFDSADFKLPYQLTGSLTTADSPLLTGLLELLQLPSWRFTREQVMVLLHNRLLQKKFDLNDNDIEQINSWLDEAGVRWGVDGQHRAELGLADGDEHSWRAGLDRLLLGFALPRALGGAIPLFAEVLSVDDVESGGSQILSRFVSYCELLFSWRKRLQQPASLAEWQTSLQELLVDLFVIDEFEESNHQQLLNVIDSLKDAAEQAGLNNPSGVTLLDSQTLISLLNGMLSSGRGGGRLSGCVNFTAMNSCAGIPFKQICLLGMNYDSWPSSSRDPGFDLLAKHLRPGDRNRSDDERYLTLQLILAAQQGLYLSYVGRDINKGDAIPPSVLLSELIDVAGSSGLPITELCHAMHAFSPANFSPANFSLANCSPTNVSHAEPTAKQTLPDGPLSRQLYSHNSRWLSAARFAGRGQNQTTPLVNEPLDYEHPEQISIEQLCSFFNSPQSAFLRNGLGLYLRDETQEWLNEEPFDLGNFSDGAVRKIALTQALAGEPGSSLIMARAAATLPHGVHGELLQAIEQGKIADLMLDLDEAFRAKSLPPHVVDFNIGDIRITGVLRNLTPQGQLVLDAGTLHDHKKVQLWLRHLLLCCARPEEIVCTTRIKSLDGSLRFTTPTNPEELLSFWLAAYCDGHSKPLPFWPKVSRAYAASILKTPDDIGKAMAGAKKLWENNFNFSGVGEKPVNQYLYRGTSPLADDAFDRWARVLLIPLLEHQQEDNGGDQQ